MPPDLTRNEVMLLLPSFTTNSSLWSALRMIESALSTTGNPNGCCDAVPLPPVLIVSNSLTVPLA